MSIGLISPTFIPNGESLVVGNDGKLSTVGSPEFQIMGTGSDDAAELIARFSADAAGPHIDFLKSRNAAINGNAIVQDNDIVGALSYYPDDGVDFATLAADFTAEVDDASPAAGDIGLAFVWRSMPGGGGAIREVMRLSASGNLTVLGSLGGGSVGGFTEGSVIIADNAGVLSEDNAGLFFKASDNFLGINKTSPTQRLQLVETSTSTNLFILMQQTATSGTGRCILWMNVISTTTGDPEIDFNITGGSQWVMGVDNSQSDRFVIAPSTALGNTGGDADVLQILIDGTFTVGAPGASVVAAGNRFVVVENGNVRMLLRNGANANPINIASISFRLKTTVSDKEAARISSSWADHIDASKEGMIEFKTANVADLPTDTIGVGTRLAIRGDMVQVNSVTAIAGIQKFFIHPEAAPATGAGDIVVGSLTDDLDASVVVTGQTGNVYITELGIVTLTAPGSETIPVAATLKITGAPVQAGSAVITTPLSLWIDAGNARFDGTILGVTGAGFILSSAAMAFQEATVISTSSGNLSLTVVADADVLLGDDATIIFVDGGTGGVGIGIASVSGTKLTLPQEDDAATPTLAFGDGNTGFYESADNSLNVAIEGATTFLWVGTGFRSVDANGPAMLNVASSGTVPGFVPDISDPNTGIGQSGADQLSLIAGGVEVVRITATLIAMNEGSANIDFKIESDGLDPIFVTDGALNTVGIGSAVSDRRFINITGSHSFVGTAAVLNVAPTLTLTDSGNGNIVAFGGSIVAASGALFTVLNIGALAISGTTPAEAAGLRIVGPPTGATVAYSLWVDAGTSRFDGDVDLNASGTLLNVGATANNWTATQLIHKGSGLSKFEITTASTNTVVESLQVQATSSGDMADNFGSGIEFLIEDGAAANQLIGEVGFRRASADNTGAFVLSTRVTGTLNEVLRVSSGGQLSVDLDSDLSATSAAGEVFDDYDDPMALQKFAYIANGAISASQRAANVEMMLEMGVVTRVPGAISGYHIVLQPMLRLVAGGIYQNRWAIDEMRADNSMRFSNVEERLTATEKALRIVRDQVLQLGQLPSA